MPLEIVKHPHPALKYKTKAIKKIDAKFREIVAEMFEIMYASEGIGLAANQVGLPYRLCVINTTGEKEKPENEVVLINPVIRKRKGGVEESEGCLSFPDIHAPVVRPETVEIEAITLNGDVRQYAWSGLLARVAQHELDHLDGIGFIERLTPTALHAIKEDIEALVIEFESNRKLGFIPSDETLLAQLREWEQQRC